MSAGRKARPGQQSAPPHPQVVLGAEIRRLRKQRGLSQRALVRVIGLSAHSNLSDYETGRRLPPADIVAACERALAVTDGYLQWLRVQALTDRADHLSRPADDPGPAVDAERTGAVWGSRTLRWVAAAGVACLIAVGAVAVAEHHHAPMTIITGKAYVGDHVATMVVDGWAYGFSDGGVSWVDSHGSWHEDGWPTCLRGPGTVRATFGVVPVTDPNGISLRQVVWVDCRR
jgi:transcriptional regulator with XRE-family HTH domain